jgi:DnaK suppressor protein
MAERKSHLSDQELAEFRGMLEEKRTALAGDIRLMEGEVQEEGEPKGDSVLSDLPTHPADVASESHQEETTRAFLESQRELLAEVDHALDRIREGTYGICEGTGKPIDTRRLRAQPWARYSIEYARQIQGKQGG